MAIEQEVRLPDGRVTLADAAKIGDTRFTNGDLAPLPIERRTWNTYNYAALWIGMSHNIPSYLLASGLIALGMNWVQAVMLIALGNLIVLVPMLLNSHAGTKYGIPYPVFARVLRAARRQPGGDRSRSSSPPPPRRSTARRSGTRFSFPASSTTRHSSLSPCSPSS